MFDYFGLISVDLVCSRIFFLQVLVLLQIGVVMEVSVEQIGDYDYIGFGSDGKLFFWFGNGGIVSYGVYVVFVCVSCVQVDVFYVVVFVVGGCDNGVLGLCLWYYLDYYVVFVFDLDGNNIEVVCYCFVDGVVV